LTSEVRAATEAREPIAPEPGRIVSVAGSGLTIEVAPHRCFACGALNEHGIHLDLHVDGDRCWTELSLPDRFQGWDGIAHGGIICTILDEVMAWSLAATDNWGLTARMSVEFKRPVRLGVPIHGEGWVTSARRRIVETAARIVDPATGEVLARATATYVAADAARKAELQARYRFRLTPVQAPVPAPAVPAPAIPAPATPATGVVPTGSDASDRA
jgi:acyl-coenzyme A thioesterase PaaI-like protein